MMFLNGGKVLAFQQLGLKMTILSPSRDTFVPVFKAFMRELTSEWEEWEFGSTPVSSAPPT